MGGTPAPKEERHPDIRIHFYSQIKSGKYSNSCGKWALEKYEISGLPVRSCQNIGLDVGQWWGEIRPI